MSKYNTSILLFCKTSALSFLQPKGDCVILLLLLFKYHYLIKITTFLQAYPCKYFTLIPNIFMSLEDTDSGCTEVWETFLTRPNMFSVAINLAIVESTYRSPYSLLRLYNQVFLLPFWLLQLQLVTSRGHGYLCFIIAFPCSLSLFIIVICWDLQGPLCLFCHYLYLSCKKFFSTFHICKEPLQVNKPWLHNDCWETKLSNRRHHIAQISSRGYSPPFWSPTFIRDAHLGHKMSPRIRKYVAPTFIQLLPWDEVMNGTTTR